jgi:hypothetical protein
MKIDGSLGIREAALPISLVRSVALLLLAFQYLVVPALISADFSIADLRMRFTACNAGPVRSGGADAFRIYR